MKHIHTIREGNTEKTLVAQGYYLEESNTNGFVKMGLYESGPFVLHRQRIIKQAWYKRIWQRFLQAIKDR